MKPGIILATLAALAAFPQSSWARAAVSAGVGKSSFYSTPMFRGSNATSQAAAGAFFLWARSQQGMSYLGPNNPWTRLPGQAFFPILTQDEIRGLDLAKKIYLLRDPLADHRAILKKIDEAVKLASPALALQARQFLDQKLSPKAIAGDSKEAEDQATQSQTEMNALSEVYEDLGPVAKEAGQRGRAVKRNRLRNVAQDRANSLLAGWSDKQDADLSLPSPKKDSAAPNPAGK